MISQANPSVLSSQNLCGIIISTVMWTRSWTEHSVVYSLNVLVRCQQTGGTSHFSLWRVNSYSPGLLKLCFGEVGTCKRGPLWAGKETEGTAQDTCLCSTLPNSDTCLCSTLPNSDTYRHGSLMTMPAGRLRGTERRQDQSENVFLLCLFTDKEHLLC